MMTKTHIGLKGFGFGLALSFAGLLAGPAGAAPISPMLMLRDAAAMPVVEAQARRPVRRQGRVVRRNNGAAVAGALVGAAILGGAIIANSEAQRREERRRAQYYYGGPQYYGGQPYYEPQPRPRRVYRQPAYEPSYQPQPRTRYRQPQYDSGYYQPQPRTRYNAPRSGRTCLVNTPDKETPYTYVPC